ncbi:MAG: VWA domain-containing protein [Chloroflexi bacterium]|nr:MAG: VWA domain-containing protein [Chloroflexota bacterium]
MTFATPELLLVLPLFGALFVWRRRRHPPAQPSLIVNDLVVLAASSHRSWRLRLGRLPDVLRVLSVVALVVAVARPQRGIAVTLLPEEGIDIVLALDMSGSMSQPTGSARGNPTRLEAARTVIDAFVGSLQGNRVGLVIFQSRSLVMSPLTLDHDALRNTVKTVQPGLLPDGTAIGLGLAEALNLLRASDARSRVVVLLTDGQNNAGEIQPLQAGQLAKTLGIRVYTVGFVSQRGGGDVDEATLRRIATESGGTYHDAATQDELAKAYAAISTLERSHIGERRFTSYEEYAPWLMGAALGLLVVETTLRGTWLRRYA